MERFLLNEDIYNEKGQLLLRKGEIVKKSTLEKLKRFNISTRSIPSSENFRPDISIQASKDRFTQKYKIRNKKLIDYPSEILSNIIFESKEQPWWFHVNLLSNYVGWLYTHSIDTALISLMIGIQLDYTDDQLWNLGLGSLLHDTGKLLIPKDILNKTKPLDNIEKLMLRQHSELGAKSLKTCNICDECIDIILHHHERLDGSGYPDGLKGNAISLNCKIVMISDAIDAISSGRPYRKPKTLNEATYIINYNKDKYSQDILNVFTMLFII